MKKQITLVDNFPEVVGLYVDASIFTDEFWKRKDEQLSLEGKIVIKLDHELFPDDKIEEMRMLSYHKISLIDKFYIETTAVHKNEKRDEMAEYAKQIGKEVIIK